MATTGSSFSVSSFPSPSSSFTRRAKLNSLVVCRTVPLSRNIACFATQESSSPAVTVAAETKKKQQDVVETEAAPAKPKPKPAKAAAVKALPELMEEDVIPSLKTTLESQDDISDLVLSFQDNKLEGSFLKKGNPYTFWAFFPDGLTGPKGFSLSSYGNSASSVEPFLVDEKKVTAKLIVFWVEKRLAAQGIIPVWNE